MIEALDELLRAAARLQVLLLQRGWRFCFIGGVAVQRWGNPRFTQDIDLTLLTGFGSEATFVDELLKELKPRRSDAREFALSRRVFLGQTEEGVDVDIALGALPFEERSVARASAWQVRQGVTLTTCSAEDLVVHKAFAGRPQDWGDIEHVLIRQHTKLDLDLIRTELKPLLELKDDSEALNRLDLLRETVERRLRQKPI
jgi:hypothetical protein